MSEAKQPLLDASRDLDRSEKSLSWRPRVQIGLLIALCALLLGDTALRLRPWTSRGAVGVARRSTWAGEAIGPATEAVRLLSAPLVDAPQPLCSWPSGTLLRFRNFGLDGPVFIAANLYNSEAVLKTWIVELPRFVSVRQLSRTTLTMQLVGPHLVHLSIYENGSSDQTVALIGHLARVLIDLGASVTIHATGDTEPRPPRYERIAMLAELRNRALAPLTNPAVEAGRPFRSVLCARPPPCLL